jgi:DNA polymerase III delta prime subunit
MHAWLIAGKVEGAREKEVIKRVKMINGRRVDYPMKSIAEVRELRKYLKLKATEPMVYVISNFDQVSVEAQNAFLKMLEEPQESVNFILTAASEDEVLATIRSRCLVIQSGSKRKVTKEIIKAASSFINESGGKKMMRVAEIRGREEAVEFLTNLILGGRELMKKGKARPEFLEAAQRALDNIKKNGNAALQLASFVVKIS